LDDFDLVGHPQFDVDFRVADVRSRRCRLGLPAAAKQMTGNSRGWAKMSIAARGAGRHSSLG
jgi:hypothetical protein